MQFTSMVFLLFFPAAAVIYFLLPQRWRQGWLLLASLVFYTWRKVWYGVFLLLSIAITWGCALLMDKNTDKKTKKIILIAGILLDLSFLVFFKYYNFTAQNVGALLGILGWENPLPFFDLAAPIGISFYTFQSLGYVLDVYRGQTTAERNPLTYALFVAFFPQILSGPISRSTTLLPQLRAEAPGFDWLRVRKGVVMVGWGFFLKMVLADRLAMFVNTVFDESPEATGFALWVALLLFAIQMYADFLSYTTIAMGAAMVFGYHLDENFRLPYFSRTIPEFWRRWHVTLGSWFKDYLFYPLMRNRFVAGLGKKATGLLPKYYAQNVPTVLALLVVWGATGLWHGPSWNYVVWGLFHGLLIIMGLLCAPGLKKLSVRLHLPTKSKAFGLLQVVRTFLLVCVGYVFFRTATLADSAVFFGNMFTGLAPRVFLDGSLLGFGLDGPDFVVALAAALLLFLVELWQRGTDVLAWLEGRRLGLRWGVYLLGLLIILVFGMYGEGYVEKPFIYFQF